jgi:hypothetical protein
LVVAPTREKLENMPRESIDLYHLGAYRVDLLEPFKLVDAIIRASTSQEPNRFDHAADIALSLLEIRLAFVEVRLENLVSGGIEGAAHPGKKSEDVTAGTFFFDHFLQATHLTFEAAQAVEDFAFVGFEIGFDHGCLFHVWLLVGDHYTPSG